MSSGEYINSVGNLQPENGKEFEIAFSGAEFATTALILVHGFGARRDSRGLFTDIVEATKDTAITVCGDFSIVDGNTSVTLPFSEQVARLRVVRQFCCAELDTQREVLVGHSQGWLPIALSRPVAKEVFALAPPLGNAFEAFIKTPGWNRRGSVLNTDGESRLIRSDGSLTLVPKEFWDEFRALGSVTPLMEELGDNNGLKIYFAGEDNVLGTQSVPEGIRTETLEDANHDFIDAPRRVLIRKLLEDLQ